MVEKSKLVALTEVSLTYPAGNTPVDRVSLDIFGSETVALVGANGSGKSTLLKMIAGYISPTDGDLRLENVPIKDFNERMLNDLMAFVEQNPEKQLIGPTVEDELARNCRMMGLKGKDIDNTDTQVLQEVSLSFAREWFLNEISLGELRRVSLGLALLGKPKLLLLDEPFSDLDNNGKEVTKAIINKYKNRGGSVIIVTKDMNDVLTLSDRIGLFQDGKLTALDKPSVMVKNKAALGKSDVIEPVIASLCLQLENQRLLTFDTCPLSLDEAVAALQKALEPK